MIIPNHDLTQTKGSMILITRINIMLQSKTLKEINNKQHPLNLTGS